MANYADPEEIRGILAGDQQAALQSPLEGLQVGAEDLSPLGRILTKGEGPIESGVGALGAWWNLLKEVPGTIGSGISAVDATLPPYIAKFRQAAGSVPSGPVPVPKKKNPPIPAGATPETGKETPVVAQAQSSKGSGLYDDIEKELDRLEEEKKSQSFNRNGNLRAFNIGGKVVFSNYDLPEDKATGAKPKEINYQGATDELRPFVRIGLGLPAASQAGSVSTIQGTDEMIRDRATRDAMMKNAAAEAVMTTDDKFKRQLEQSKQLAQAQSEVKTQGTIDQYRRLAELMSGTKVEPDTPVFNETKTESFKKLQILRDKGAEETKHPDGTPKTDEELWKEAWVAAKQKHDKEFADQVWRVFLTEKRADPALMYNMSGTDSTPGG